MREVLRSKIHRAWVTEANPDYVGSIVIDEALMEKTDLWEYEKVLVCDVTNGNRFETYVLPGERGRGDIAVQARQLASPPKATVSSSCPLRLPRPRSTPRWFSLTKKTDSWSSWRASSMSSRFTEQETETYYDAEDAIYRTIWDEDGSVHWGYFDDSTGTDFLKGCANLDRIMVEKGRIAADARVLDMGCGNGTTAIWLAQHTGCHATGIDLSGVRIDNAKAAREQQAPALRDRLAFEKASATELPFAEGTFSRVWSRPSYTTCRTSAPC